MSQFSLLPLRCIRCGEPSFTSELCQKCYAAFSVPIEPQDGLVCRHCGQGLLAETGLCIDCAQHQWHFDQIWGLAGYQQPLAELLRLYKFQGATVLARFWARRALLRLIKPSVLIPVPPLRRHLKEREWDPVHAFCRELARRSHFPILKALVRNPSASQKALRQTERWQNASQAYRLRPSCSRRLKHLPHVWLVDDVVTTGATAEICAQLLKNAGVNRVDVLSIGLH